MARSILPSLFGSDKHPMTGFHSLQKEIDRVFDEFRSLTPHLEFGDSAGRVVPKLDIGETDDAIEITAELPGVKEEDIDVSVSGNVLTLRGEKSASRDETKKDFRVVERSYGSFARSIPFAFDIDAEGVSAEFKDGVLTIDIKKPAEVAAKTQKIALNKPEQS